MLRFRGIIMLGLVPVVLGAAVGRTEDVRPPIVPRGSVEPQIPVAQAPRLLPAISTLAIVTTGDVTRISMALSGPLAVDAFTLSSPYRLVVDLPEARFDFAGRSPEARGLVRSWRAGLFATGRSRIVFDTATPARILSKVIEPQADGSARLVLELQSITADQFAALALDERARPAGKLPLFQSPAGQTSLTGPAGKSDREVPRALPDTRKLVVVIDPGHGGIDAGTVSPHTGMPEKQVVLEFSRLLEKKLTDSGRYQVFLTRTADTFVPLGERVKFARAHHADLLISIHADAELDRSVRGSTVFTRAEKASDSQAAALAVKENQSDALAGVPADDRVDDVADILIDLTVRETRQFSHRLAHDLVENLGRTGRMVKQSPHRSASLVVLKAYDFPSVLIELGFLSNKDDESELVSPKWRDVTAGAITASIDRFFASYDAKARP